MNNANTTTPPKGYKNTAIGIIPIDWETKKLGDLGEIINGLTYSPNEISDDGILVLRSSNIKDRQLVYTDNVFVKADKYNPVKKGDVLICVRNGSKSLIGKNALITAEAEGYAFGAFMAVFRSDYNNYLYQIFGTDLFQKEIHKNLGATINSINGSDLKLFKLPIPPLPEQQKIAAILSTWDDAIFILKQTSETLRDRNKGLAQQLLTGKKRLKGFNDSWLTKRIKDFSLEISSKNKEDEDLIVLSCTKHRGLIPSLEYFGRKIYSDNLKTYKIVEKNVFAYATNHIEEGSIGYQSKYEKALISPMYTVFKTDDDINDEFLFRVLKSNTYIQEYQKRMEGSIDRRGGLRWQEFSKIKVSVPSYEEQTAIALALETADQELKSYETKLEALQLQKKGLMQQLLTGKIRVNVNKN